MEEKIQLITDELTKLLLHKNKSYGNAALEPLQIFSNKCKVGTRIDDKLSRVKNNTELNPNDVIDIMGYLVLVCIEKNITDFSKYYE